jgi:hypothetical protein
VNYTIPKVDYQADLVPYAVFDQPPEYFISGGLVFQPLNNSFLKSWGSEWRRRAPFRLNYYNNQERSKDHPSLVLLSQILPDPFNLGYQEYRFLVVDQINGVKISDLNSVQEAFKKSQGGFHVITLMKGDSLQKLVVDATDADKATQRVLSRYGIEKASVIVGDAPKPAVVSR